MNLTEQDRKYGEQIAQIAETARKEGTAAERARIAEWIRSGDCIDWELDEIADAIERGYHAKPEGKP